MTLSRHTADNPQRPVQGPGWLVRAMVIGWLAMVLGATLYESAVAMRLVDLGQLPGEDPFGRTTLVLATTAALLGGGIVLGIAGIGGVVRDVADPSAGGGARLLGSPELSLVPLSAAAFFIAHYFSFDAHYAPSLRRFSTDIPAEMVVVVGCWAALAAVGLRVRWVTRPAAIAAGILLLVIWLGVILGGSH